ncbi:hypothetical protein HY469_04225 [Candidatus Roizmanbacteria bacterium]|nr:hypothetical protein [Candidatus Roizmanbacteria bacterium]
MNCLNESEVLSFLNRPLNRREAIAEIAAFAGLVGLAGTSGFAARELLPNNEGLEPYASEIFTSDIGLNSWWAQRTYRITQPYRSSNTRLLQRLLGDEYPGVGDLAFNAVRRYVNQTMNHSSFTTREQGIIESLVDISLQERTIPTLLQIVDAKFSIHSAELSMHRTNVLRQLGLRTDRSMQVLPVQDHIFSVLNEENGIEWEGPGGLLGTRIRTDASGVRSDIKNYLRRGSIWALPLQLGTVGFYHEPNPMIEPEKALSDRLMSRIHMVGAYHPERAYESLGLLADIVSELGIVTIAAGGNTIYDLTEEPVERLREEGRWPDDLIILAGEALFHKISTKDEFGQDKDEYKYKSWYGSYGGPQDTIYVDNYNIGQEYIGKAADWDWVVYGSSAAVWTVAIWADMLRKQGVPLREIKPTMKKMLPPIKDHLDRPMRVLPSLQVLKKAA